MFILSLVCIMHVYLRYFTRYSCRQLLTTVTSEKSKKLCEKTQFRFRLQTKANRGTQIYVMWDLHALPAIQDTVDGFTDGRLPDDFHRMTVDGRWARVMVSKSRVIYMFNGHPVFRASFAVDCIMHYLSVKYSTDVCRCCDFGKFSNVSTVIMLVRSSPHEIQYRRCSGRLVPVKPLYKPLIYWLVLYTVNSAIVTDFLWFWDCGYVFVIIISIIICNITYTLR